MYQFVFVFIVILLYLLTQKKNIQNFSDTDKYFKDVLNDKEKKELDTILSATLNHLKKENIEYFVSFGSLIGAVRHGNRMPFDDDIDLLVNNSNLEKLFDNLKIIRKGENQITYYLTDDIEIIHKKWGCPIKIQKKNSNFPFIDIFVYDNNNNNIIVPNNQLVNGHTKSFNEKYNDIFPLKSAKFDRFIVNIPKNYNKVLKNLYGNKVLEECVITWNHKMSSNDKKHFNKKIVKMSDVKKEYKQPYIY